MDEAETLLKQQFGTRQPFTVPDGYFETIADRVMARLPEHTTEVSSTVQDHRLQPWQHWRTLVSVAACACAILLGGTWIARLSAPDATEGTPVAVSATIESQDLEFDDMADYVMIDNEDIYALVANN